ncbi:hypothetical protein [Microbacterium sp. No. 7]|uniref:hypothetical protein n=1 Tax=Microbacterium sp. No. 7 TaxID=1714373 RepID=UPI0006D1C1A9|nr:hypothetical protein [Microbacterium sp. No. 7]ALJ19846.1 hypothetical protein AOA12_07975 [Microbacterium sp. No. 7]
MKTRRSRAIIAALSLAVMAGASVMTGSFAAAEQAVDATPSEAGVQRPASQAAGTYAYNAGHPIFFGSPGSNPGSCTGGYTVYGTSGSFILTAGHCGTVGGTVYGTGAAFGTLAHKKNGAPHGDSALISFSSNVIAYQIVVNPLNGARPGPGGQGRITGIMPTSEQTTGKAVGKMGKTSGWTEGTIVGTYDWKGVDAVLADYPSGKGDSGGPVWRWDSAGLRAVGINVGYVTQGQGGPYVAGVYLPIETVLSQWGASMNVFSSATARQADGVLGADRPSEALRKVSPGPVTDLPVGLPDICADIDCVFVEG